MQENGDAPFVIGSPVFKDMYWSVFQMLTHHASGGCNFQPGDFYGSGTISGTEKDQLGSLLEASVGGMQEITFPTGETRTFLEDGDEVVMRAWCDKDGAARIGFGECRSIILPADGGTA
jgi:fumarylacetoacetase